MDDAVGIIVASVVGLAVLVFFIAAMWKVFTKAGKPGWAAIIPFYNTYVLLKIAGRPGWWLVLYFIPLVQIVIGIIVLVDIAKSYGKGTGFAVLLVLLPYVGFPILGYGSATYLGPAAQDSAGGGQGQYGQDPAYPPQPGYPPPQGYPPSGPMPQQGPPSGPMPPQGYPPQGPPPQGYPPQGYPQGPPPQGYPPQGQPPYQQPPPGGPYGQ